MNNARLNWEPFYREGNAYCERVIAAARSGKYNPEVLHGLAAMAAEKMLMALLLYRGKMPMGHTFADLLAETSEMCTVNPVLAENLLLVDQLVPLCSLDPTESWEVDRAHVPMLVETAIMTRDLVDCEMSDSASVMV